MKKSAYIVASLLVVFIIFIGPWPVDNTPFKDTQYAQETFEGINKLSFSQNKSEIKAGYAKRDITPEIGGIIGGYSARNPKKNTGIYEKVFVKAITIQNSETTVTIVNSETLLPLPELINAVISKTKLKRNELFFTSTHTHSGPGGYASGLIAQQALGDYSQAYFDYLVKKHVDAILESRKTLTLAELYYSNTTLNPELTRQLLFNQLQPQNLAHNTLQILRIKDKGNNKNIASIITFSAHPTFFGRRNTKISGDYPSLLTAQFESEFGGGAMFIPGGVGGTIPRVDIKKISSAPESPNLQRHEFSQKIFNVIKPALLGKASTEKTKIIKLTSTSINSVLIPIILPTANFRISDSLRLSPILVNALFHNQKSYIHVLTLGSLAIFSYPADYSGLFAKDLENYALNKGVSAWITSFNGDYIGYLTPSEFYSTKHHITRDTNIYGPFGGDYFNFASKRVVDRMVQE